MASVIVRRLAAAVVIFVLVSMMTFALVLLVPGDPAATAAGDSATPEQILAIREQLGLNNPIWQQYANWIGGVLHGDFGRSLTTGEDVLAGLWSRFPATLSLMAMSLLIALLVGLPVGLIAGLRPGSLLDRLVSGIAILGIAIPNFWLGLLLIIVFALQFGWFPSIGYVPLSQDPVEWLRSLVLPGLTLGLGCAAEIARQTRTGVIDVSSREYVRTAYANGLPEHRVVGRHILRNASIPVVTVLGIQIAHLLGGSIIVETIFGINGVGRYAVEAVIVRDFPVVQGTVLFVTIVVLIANLAVDISYSYLNPKVRTT